MYIQRNVFDFFFFKYKKEMSNSFKINGALTNPEALTNAIYANQNNEFVSDAVNNEILYYSNGAPASSANFTFNDDTSLMNLTGNVAISGICNQNGVMNVNNDFNNSGDARVCIDGPDPFTSSAPGPVLRYREKIMPLYWTTTIVVPSQTSAGFNPGSTAIEGRNYVQIDGPYIASSLSTQVFGFNGNPGANRDFYVLGVNIYSPTFEDIPDNGKVGSVQLWCRGGNTAPARANIGILFIPPN